MLTWVAKWIVVIFLAVYTVMDLRGRRIWWPLAVILMALGGICHLILPGSAVMESVWGMLLGAGIFGMSQISGHAIGAGDCVAVAACGAWLGFAAGFELFFLALVFSALWAVLLLARGKGRKETFPFIPFLLASQICLLFR